MRRLSLSFLLTTLLLAGLSVVWLMREKPHPTHRQSTEAIRAFMTNVRYTSFTPKGQLHAQGHADTITYFQKNGRAVAERPRITYYTEDHIPWHIIAQHAQRSGKSDALYLWGNVKLHQPPRPDHLETTVLTDRVHFNPKTAIAKTQAKATVIRPDATLSGQGAIANFNRGSFEFLSQSHGTLTPHATQ